MGQSEQKMGGNNVKWQDVVIKKVFFCMFDTTLEVVPYSGYVPGDEDEMYRYLCQMVAKYYYHETSRKGFIHEESELQQILPETEKEQDVLSYVYVEEVLRLTEKIQDNPQIGQTKQIDYPGVEHVRVRSVGERLLYDYCYDEDRAR